jgi:hypothetical protein
VLIKTLWVPRGCFRCCLIQAGAQGHCCLALPADLAPPSITRPAAAAGDSPQHILAFGLAVGENLEGSAGGVESGVGGSEFAFELWLLRDHLHRVPSLTAVFECPSGLRGAAYRLDHTRCRLLQTFSGGEILISCSLNVSAARYAHASCIARAHVFHKPQALPGMAPNRVSTPPFVRMAFDTVMLQFWAGEGTSGAADSIADKLATLVARLQAMRFRALCRPIGTLTPRVSAAGVAGWPGRTTHPAT